MKLKSILLITLLGSLAAFAAQDTFKAERTYKAGDADSYRFTSTVKSSMGDIQMSMNMSQKVDKVYENGDADVTTTVTDMTIDFNGQKMNPSAQPGTTQRMNKFGRTVGDKARARGGMDMSWMQYGAYFNDKEMKVGETINIDEKDEKAKTSVKGTVKLDSVANGIGTYVIDMNITTPESAKPMNVKAKSSVASDGRLQKMTGTVTGLPTGNQGIDIESVNFTMEKTK